MTDVSNKTEETVPETTIVPEAVAVKHDHGKPRVSLIPSSFTLGVAEVLTFGAQKYRVHNWRTGMSYSRLIDATFRHLLAFQEGEDLDSESGLSHVHHAACNLAFLSELVKTHPEFDDRYIPELPVIDAPEQNSQTVGCPPANQP